MSDFIQHFEIRWSDLDPNFHLRHSVYYDFGAFTRITFLANHGVPPSVLLQHNIGPVLFREECVFKKEIRFGEKVSVNLQLDKLSADLSRWTMIHELFKNDGQLAAVITVDGAWLDTQKRKLALPPAVINNAVELIPKTTDFKMP